MVAKFLDLNNRSPEDMPAKKKKKNEKMVCMTSSVHDCTQEQHGSLYFNLSTMRMAVSVKIFEIH